MSRRSMYNSIRKYTDDKVVLSLAKNWMNKNRFFKSIYNIFGIEINRKFQINVTERVNKYGNIETIFRLSTGFHMFKKEFIIRLV